MAQHVNTEEKVINIFKANIGKDICLEGETYFIGKLIGKPRPKGGGECKTDCFVELKDSEANTVEPLKISIKQPNADFTANKLTDETAENELGVSWQEVISEHTNSIRENFIKRQLIYYAKKSKVEAGSVTLGWRFEIMNKISGDLSGEIHLDTERHYQGNDLSPDKKNSIINGIEVTDCGIANRMLECYADDISSLFDVSERLSSVHLYARRNPDLFFSCKALNCRTLHAQPFKIEGNRCLSVQVYWQAFPEENKLSPYILFNSPLLKRGQDMKEILIKALNALNCNNTEDLRLKSVIIEEPTVMKWS